MGKREIDYLSTRIIAFVGQVLTQIPQPKHNSGLNERELSTISLAMVQYINAQRSANSAISASVAINIPRNSAHGFITSTKSEISKTPKVTA